jgi:hypothetical protein
MRPLSFPQYMKSIGYGCIVEIWCPLDRGGAWPKENWRRRKAGGTIARRGWGAYSLTGKAMSVQKERERDFHNRRFSSGAHDIREPLGKWYGALAANWREQDKLIRLYVKGQRAGIWLRRRTQSLLHDRLPIGTSGVSGID